MSKRTLTALTGTLIALIMIVIVALIANRKTEPEVETEETHSVGIRIIEEETHEEETTVAAVTASAFKPTVATEATSEAETEVPSYSVEEIANYVLDNGINGPEREEFCGDRYEEVQEWINQNHVPPVRYEEPEYDPDPAYYEGGDVLTPSAGVNYYGGIMETYYCLDMTGVVQIMRSLGYDEASYPYWVRNDGVKMLGDFVMVAADFGQFPRGSIVQTSLGTGIVCDTGSGGWNWFDIAVTWG